MKRFYGAAWLCASLALPGSFATTADGEPGLFGTVDFVLEPY